MPEELIAKIDKAAEEENRSRSEFLREAVKFYLEIRKYPMTPGQDPLVRKAIAIQNEIARRNSLPNWDSVSEIRKWRG